MNLTEIASLMASAGTLLVGIASVITAIKKEPKEHQQRKAKKFK